MRKLTLSLAALLLIGGSVFAEIYRVHYSIKAVAGTSPSKPNHRVKLDGHGDVSRCACDRRYRIK
jgi:hypothetical protein